MVGSHEPEVIETETGTAYRTIYRLERSIQEPITRKLAEIIREKVEEFRESLPVIITLGNPSLKARHWEQISEIVGFPIKIDQTMTLAKVSYFPSSCNNSISFIVFRVHIFYELKKFHLAIIDSRLRPSRLRYKVRDDIRGSNERRKFRENVGSNVP